MHHGFLHPLKSVYEKNSFEKDSLHSSNNRYRYRKCTKTVVKLLMKIKEPEKTKKRKNDDYVL